MTSAPMIRYCLPISRFVEVQVAFFTKLTSDVPDLVMSNNPVIIKGESGMKRVKEGIWEE